MPHRDPVNVYRQVHHFAGTHRLLVTDVSLQEQPPHVLVRLHAPWWAPHWLTERMDRRYQRDLERVLPGLRVQVVSA
jgi:hypothetical protein